MKSTNYKKVVTIVLIVLSFFHFYAIFNLGLTTKSFVSESLPIEGNLEGQLILIHTVIGVFLLIFALSLAFKTLISRIVSLVSITFVTLTYFWWYYEKFAYLEPEGTTEFDQQISEIGLFQGATSLDYWILVITLILAIYSIFRFFCASSKDKV